MPRAEATQRAIRVIEGAKKEADRLRHLRVGTGHILLSLIREEGMAAAILMNRGIDFGMVDQEVAVTMAHLLELPAADDNPFTLNAWRALGLALDEADRLGDDFIGTEHLLLGLAAEGDGVAATTLGSLDVSYAQVLAEARRLLG